MDRPACFCQQKQKGTDMMLSSWRGVVDWSLSFLRWLFELWLAVGSQAGMAATSCRVLVMHTPHVRTSCLLGLLERQCCH
jgi:hypothetical protein